MNRVGGGITPAVLPHHTDVPFGIRRFMKQTGSVDGYPSTKPAPCGRTISWGRHGSYAWHRRSTTGLPWVADFHARSSSSFATDPAFAQSSKTRLSHQSHKSVSRGEVISELHNSSLALQPANWFALLTDQTRLSPCLRGLLLPGFHQSSHLFLALDITTVATGHSPRVGLSPTGFAASFAARGLTPPSECALPGAPSKGPETICLRALIAAPNRAISD
jgi:hypothetical protein